MQGIIPGFIKASGELIVGTVAPLRREKNLGRLLRAFAAVRGEFKVRLLIAGDGPERAELARLADSLGITDVVVFAGHVDRVEGVLGWFDVFAMSSDTEQMPNSLLQAMAAGLPVVATDVGDIKHILPSHNAALVVPKNDELSFASALRRLLAEPALRNKSGQRNREQVRAHYGFDQMVEAYRSLLEDACAATHAERPRDHALGRAVIK
jgi:glycosyltransferase involved in cell wall biosynthesis